MSLSKQQWGYVIAVGIGVVALGLVFVLLRNVHQARQPLLDHAKSETEAQERIARGLLACQETQDPVRCAEQMTFREAETLGRVALCEALEGPSHVTCVTLVAQATLDREDCRTLDGVDRNICEDDVTTRLAERDLDPRLCAGVQQEDGRARCTERVTAAVVASGACAEHGVDPFLCEEQSLYLRALETADPTLCDRLEDADRQRGCREDARRSAGDPEDDVNPNQDSDGDGLLDSEETAIYGTNPQAADTDGDGYSDGQEVQNGFDPNSP